MGSRDHAISPAQDPAHGVKQQKHQKKGGLAPNGTIEQEDMNGTQLDASVELPSLKKKEKKKQKGQIQQSNVMENGDRDDIHCEEADVCFRKKKKQKKLKKVEVNGDVGEALPKKIGNHLHVNGIESVQKKRKHDSENEFGTSQRKNGALEDRKKSKLEREGVEKSEKKRMGINLLNGDRKADVELEVKVSGRDAEDERFTPVHLFTEVQVPKNVLDCCKGFKRPSPIQAHAWPFLLDGRDLIGIAATGSGKTLAYGLPALVHVMKRKENGSGRSGSACLVLSPTRELAQQISEVLVEAGLPCGIKTACLYGGTSKKPQYAALKAGVDIIVATPGRLQDLVEEGRCSLQGVSFVVLDEADRMLDLGFEHAVRALVGCTLKSRQTIMFSATWPSVVHELAKEFMGEHPIKVIVGSQELSANHAVTQIVEVIDTAARDARLFDLLKAYHKSERNRILVFVLYKKEAIRVEAMLQRRGWNVSAVHGDKGQADRNKAVMAFKDGSCPLLIATDVAARGLDIPDVEYVINYSFPLTTEDYVHRIGRTGRAGKDGIAHTFFTHGDKARAGELINVLKEAGQRIPPELLKFGTSVKKKESKLYGAHFKDVASDAPKATKITFDSDEE